MNVPLGSGSARNRPIADLDLLPGEISDDLLIQSVASAFARKPLAPDELRDIRLVAFLLDLVGRQSASQLAGHRSGSSRVVVVDDELKSLSGLSAGRIQRSISRLVEARVLEQSGGDPAGWFRLAPGVMRPAGIDQYVDWPVVMTRIAGHVPAVLLLRAILDLVAVPWDWTRLTYEQLAARASYSLGMAQRGVEQLLKSGVLECATHSGRGHDYRLSSWALGRAPVPDLTESLLPPTQDTSSRGVIQPVELAREPAHQPAAATSSMAVEIGGLVLRVPVGTEIRMTVGPDGEMHYEVGSELKITRRS